MSLKVWFDKKQFNNQCNEMLDDVEAEKLRSKAWVWIAAGAISGMVMRCMKVSTKSGKAILAKIHGNNKIED